MIVGYIRVSTFDQNTDRQLDGVQLDKVFEDKVSGKNTDRPRLTDTATTSGCTTAPGTRPTHTTSPLGDIAR
ncbi:recombinase family protein [Kribbella turkmenica]